MTSRALPFLAVLALVTFTACGDDSGPPPDGSVPMDGPAQIDGGRRDGGPTATAVCMATRAITGMTGTMTVTGDTSLVNTRPTDLGPDCGNAGAARFAPQEVLAYT